MSSKPDLTQVLPSSAQYVDDELQIGGVAVSELARRHGTPLYIYDQQHLRSALAECIDGLSQYAGTGRVAYATKAFSSLAMIELVAAAGAGADVASLGELEIALRAGVDPGLIVMHGNAKTREQLQRAIDAGVGLIIVDSRHELGQINDLAASAGVIQHVLVRINPDIATDTHEYIQTGHADSKFGVMPEDGIEMLVTASDLPGIAADGFHMHVGSQLLNIDTWAEAAAWSADYGAQLHARGFATKVLDLGGGHGIAYTPADAPISNFTWARGSAEAVTEAWAAASLDLPELILEPGRCIAGPAGVTAYEVITTKHAGQRQIAAVDGGMSDNPRPMLYDAIYSCLPASEPADDAQHGAWHIAGMHCESGDILIDEAQLPDLTPGDVIVMPATGAYGHAMSSRYNAQLGAAVVFVEDGDSRVVVRRETIDDLLAREQPLVSHESAGAR